MKKRALGIVLGVSVLFALGLFVLMAWASVSVQPLAISPDGAFMAWRPLLNWSWSGEKGAFKDLLITDLRNGKTVTVETRHGLRRWGLRGEWSGGDHPKLAVRIRGSERETWGEHPGPATPDSLLVYSTRDGSMREMKLPENAPFEMTWGPDGRYLLLASGNSDEEGLAIHRVLLWWEGLAEPVYLGAPAGIKWFQGYSLLEGDQALLALSGEGGAWRFFLADVKDTEAMKEVTGCFPPVKGVGWISHRRTNPDTFLIATHPKGTGKSSAILTRYPSPEVVQSWEGVSSAWIGREGKTIIITNEEVQHGEVTKCEYVKVSLADFSKTKLFSLEGEEARYNLVANTEMGWYGWSGGAVKKTLLGRSWSYILRDEKCFKSVPLHHEGTLGWTGGAGHWRFGLVRQGPFFRYVTLLDPLTCDQERIPSPHAWRTLLSPQMGIFWLSLVGFLVNALLFAVLFYGRSASEGARPLGFLFWSVALACLLFDGDGIFAVTQDTYFQEPFGFPFRVSMHGAGLLMIFALSALPCATLLFATEFPAPNAYRIKYPRLVGAFRALTFAVPFLLLVAELLDSARSVLYALGNSQAPNAADKAWRGIEAATSVVQPVILGSLVWAVLILVLTAAAVVHNFRFAPSPRVRGQLLYVSLGIALSVAWAAVGAFLYSLVYVAHPDFGLLYSAILVFIPALFCGYALLAKELLDISFVVRRTVKYAIVIGALGLIFVGLVAGLGVLLPAVFSARSEVAVALASVVSALAFQPLRRGVQGWVDRRFDRARYDARKTLSDLTSRFATMGSAEQIRTTLEGAARDVMRVGECRLLFFQGGKLSASSNALPQALEPVDVSGLEPRELQGLLSVELPWVRLALPVGYREHAYAVLATGEKLSQEKFSGEDREFLKILTDGAGLALRNLALVKEAARAEILQRDLEEARTVQLRQLPRSLPAIPGFEVAASTQAARIVGGDYYDVIPLPEGRYAFVIADVSGKGMPAALRMADVRSHLHALLRRVPYPAEILGETNLYLCAQENRNEFTTMLLGILDPASGTLRLSSAGHLPPLLAERGTGVKTVAVLPALPLGADPSETYSEREVFLPEERALFLMSDGLPERKNGRGELLGFDGVEEAIRGLDFERPADALLGGLLARADAFAEGADSEDDQTVIVVRALKGRGLKGGGR